MRSDNKRRKLWVIWLVVTSGLIAWLAITMLTEATDKSVFMPGALSPGHHQLQQACTACHGDPLSGSEVLQEACINCHGEDRKKPSDSHPASKFRDPRNADRLGDIDALHCVTCHTEHRPEITAKNGLTQPRDICFHCHADVSKDRPSHEGMAFDTCATAGCHNFHNNRSLYTDFLIKHLDEPDLLDEARVPAREYAQILDQIADYPLDHYPIRALAPADADATIAVAPQGGEALQADWAVTAHARSGVNCSACHQPKSDAVSALAWTNYPDETVCSNCHTHEVKRFARGKHGMRLAVDLEPLQVSDARLPMRDDAGHERLTCNSCHSAHRYDVRHAATEACLGCHDDRHTLAYEGSPHQKLWAQELAGALPEGSGVSCASCHMPRISFDVSDWLSRIMVDHNQSANLSPNSKMIRSSCLHCHGMAFSIDALSDPKLVDSNFTGQPSGHVETMELAAAEKERREQEAAEDDDAAMFGF